MSQSRDRPVHLLANPSSSALGASAIAALVTVYVVWSSTYLAIRVVVRWMPPFLSAGARFAIAGLVLLAIDRARGKAMPSMRDWIRALPIGLFLFAGGNGFVALAELRASSGAAALACALAPVWGAVLSREKQSTRRWIGFLLGLAGVALLSSRALPDARSMILLALAPISWALGTLLAKRWSPSPASAQLFVGGTATALVGVVLGETIPESIPMSAWLSWIYLAIFGSMIAFSAYAYLVRHASVPVAMSYAYVNPVLAVILGALLGGESIGGAVIASGVLVTSAVVLIISGR